MHKETKRTRGVDIFLENEARDKETQQIDKCSISFLCVIIKRQECQAWVKNLTLEEFE